MSTPHRVVDGIVTGIADGAQGVIDGGLNALRSAGGSIMAGLDKPFRAITGKEGPHHIVGRLADGAAGTVQNAVDQGLIGSARAAGESVMKALDQPSEQIGIPPDVEPGKSFLPKFGMGR